MGDVTRRFENKVAFVTGAASGMGRAAAIRFAQEGAFVAMADWNGDNHAADALREVGGDGVFLRCDVSREDEVRDAIAETVARHGRLDHAFNNAGIPQSMTKLTELDEDEWDQVINVDLKGIWLCMKHELQQMVRQGGGTIVNTSSIAGNFALPRGCAYTAAKHGVLGLTKSAAIEYGKDNIRVNAICPGAVDTAMPWSQTPRTPETLKAVASMSVLNRIGQPEDIAAAALWLSSDDAAFVTGASVHVDGGWNVALGDPR